MGSACVMFAILKRTCIYQHEVYLQITRYEIVQSSCKRDTKSKSHPGTELAPVRVFSCKHPLILATDHTFCGFTGVTAHALPIECLLLLQITLSKTTS